MTGRLVKEIKQSKPFHSVSLEVYINVVRTADELSRCTGSLLRAQDLTLAQYNVLRILIGAGSDGLPCNEIGNRLITHDPDVTRLIDRLEKRQYVARSRDNADRRVVTVRITSEGVAVVQACDMDRRATEILAERFTKLSPDDCQTLITLLENLRKS